MRIFFYLTIFILLFAEIGLAVDAQSMPSHLSSGIYLFHIERNKNKNQVHYSIRLDKDCRLKNKNPVYVYWLNLESKKPEVSSIRWFQQPAYGIHSQVEYAPGQLKLRLKALPDRIIYVEYSKNKRTKKCQVRTSTYILGTKTSLYKIYVFAETKFVVPGVKYIDIFGKLSDGSSVKERIKP